jgi:hypothetical protein
MRFKHVFVGFVCFTLIIGCQNKYPLKAYYFPLQKLIVPAVYEYTSNDDSTALPYYLYLQTVKDNDSLKLVINYYDNNLLPSQLIIEKKVKNGMKLQKMDLYFQDSLNTKTEVNIKSRDVFPFVNKDTNVIFLYSVNWIEPNGDKVTLIRNKRFSKDTIYNYGGVLRDAIVFEINEEINIENQGNITLHNRSLEVYADGIGLVENKKTIDNGNKTRTYKLKDIYPMETLEKRFHKQLNKQ